MKSIHQYHDGHVHFFPPQLKTAIDHWFEREGWVLYYRDQQASELLELLRKDGVDQLAVLVYAHKPGMASELNSWLHQFGQQHAGLHLFGTVHPDDVNMEEEVRRCLDDLNFTGFKLHANVQRVSVDDERLEPMMRGIQERGRGLIIHAGREPHANAFVGWRPFSRLMARYPQLKVQIAHLGHDEIAEFIAVSHDYPHVYFDTAMIPSSRFLLSTERLGEILNEIPNRIIYGSDLPILEEPMAYHRTRILPAIEDPGLRDKVFLRNAERFWRSETDA